MSWQFPKNFGLDAVEILSSTLCHDGFLQVERLQLRCRLYEGGWSPVFTREVLRREPGAGVLLYDPRLDKVLLVEQFRVGCLDDRDNGPWALELVAGLVESGESPAEVAIREAEEEAGLVLQGLLPVCEYYNSPGGSSEKLSVFCAGFNAAGLEPGIFGLAGESENIRTVLLDRKEALSAVAAGRINNAMSIIALQWLQLNLEQVRLVLLAESG
jgi:ADP-ribose pyrophosphatase